MNTSNRNLLIGALLLGGAFLYFRNKRSNDLANANLSQGADSEPLGGGGGGFGGGFASASKPSVLEPVGTMNVNVTSTPIAPSTSWLSSVVDNLKKTFVEQPTTYTGSDAPKPIIGANPLPKQTYTSVPNRYGIATTPTTTTPTTTATATSTPTTAPTKTVQSAGISPISASSTYSFFDVDGDDSEFDSFID